MRLQWLLGSLVLLASTPVFAAELDPAYRQTFGETTILATNGEYPPVATCNPSQFDWKGGASHVVVSAEAPIMLRAIMPKGKRFKEYLAEVVKTQGGNLKHKQSDVFYFQLWTDRDEDGNVLDPAKHPWPTSLAEVPSWEPVGFFTTKFGPESGEWETVGLNAEGYMENLQQHLFTAKAGQKFYVTVAVGYKYLVGAGQPEQKWDSVKKKTVTVISTGELGFAVSPPLSAGTIVVKQNKITGE